MDSNEKLQQKPYDYLHEIKSALKEAFELVESKMFKRKEQSKEAFDRNRQPLNLKPGDFTFIKYPYNIKLKKLHPKAYGPFEIVKVSHHPDTGDLVSVECNIEPTKGSEPKLKVFPRCRLRPIQAQLPKVNWDNLLGLPLNESPKDISRPMPSSSHSSELNDYSLNMNFAIDDSIQEIGDPMDLYEYNPDKEISLACSYLMTPQ